MKRTRRSRSYLRRQRLEVGIREADASRQSQHSPCRRTPRLSPHSRARRNPDRDALRCAGSRPRRSCRPRTTTCRALWHSRRPQDDGMGRLVRKCGGRAQAAASGVRNDRCGWPVDGSRPRPPPCCPVSARHRGTCSLRPFTMARWLGHSLVRAAFRPHYSKVAGRLRHFRRARSLGDQGSLAYGPWSSRRSPAATVRVPALPRSPAV